MTDDPQWVPMGGAYERQTARLIARITLGDRCWTIHDRVGRLLATGVCASLQQGMLAANAAIARLA